MKKIGKYKEDIIEALNNIVRYADYQNKAGRFDINKDAEEFYRGLLLLVYGWELGKNANDEINPNYEGVDLLYLGKEGSKIAVQVTSENDSEKVHKSIRGFKAKALNDGYTELYILMFKGKQDFPKADFAKSVDNQFTFEKNKHIIDHSDLCAKLKDAEDDYTESIWKYLEKWDGLKYGNLDESTNDLGIIGEIFEYIQTNKPRKLSSNENILSSASIDLIPKIKINFPIEQRDEISRLIKKVWDKKEIVKLFMEKQIEEDEVSVNELTITVQDDYCKIKNHGNEEAKVEDIQILRSLAVSYVPNNKKKEIGYIANAEALVFYFFEFCFIGNKTEHEKNNIDSSSQLSISFD